MFLLGMKHLYKYLLSFQISLMLICLPYAIIGFNYIIFVFLFSLTFCVLCFLFSKYQLLKQPKKPIWFNICLIFLIMISTFVSFSTEIWAFEGVFKAYWIYWVMEWVVIYLFIFLVITEISFYILLIYIILKYWRKINWAYCKIYFAILAYHILIMLVKDELSGFMSLMPYIIGIVVVSFGLFWTVFAYWFFLYSTIKKSLVEEFQS